MISDRYVFYDLTTIEEIDSPIEIVFGRFRYQIITPGPNLTNLVSCDILSFKYPISLFRDRSKKYSLPFLVFVQKVTSVRAKSLHFDHFGMCIINFKWEILKHMELNRWMTQTFCRWILEALKFKLVSR